MTIAIKALNKAYGKTPVLQELSFSFGPGLYHLVGKNGSGKSTLLRLIAGLDKHYQGEIVRPERLLYLTTQAIGIGYYSLRENISLLAQALAYELRDEDWAWLALFFDQDLDQLYQLASTGTKAKLGLGLINLPIWQGVIIDETLSVIDLASQEQISQVIEQLSQTVPVIYVNHSQLSLDAQAQVVELSNLGERTC